MKERKYKEDWKNETRFNEKTGREQQVPVYRGNWYSLPAGENRKQLGLTALLPWIGFITLLFVYFKLNFPGATTMYVFLPAALGLFPALYWAMGAWGVFHMPDKMTRLQKENGPGRVLRSAAGCAVCGCAAVLGDLVLLIAGGQAAREWPGTLILLAAALAAFGTAVRFRELGKHLTETGGENT